MGPLVRCARRGRGSPTSSRPAAAGRVLRVRSQLRQTAVGRSRPGRRGADSLSLLQRWRRHADRDDQVGDDAAACVTDSVSQQLRLLRWQFPRRLAQRPVYVRARCFAASARTRARGMPQAWPLRPSVDAGAADGHRHGPGSLSAPVAAWDPARGILIRGATVVTMDTEHSVIHDGQVLVRSGQIAAVWQGRQPPAGLDVGNPSIIEADPDDLLFPGLINLHDHPSEDFLYLVLPPSSDAIASQGKSGTDPYANRYQWRNPATMPPEFARLLINPVGVLVGTVRPRAGNRGALVRADRRIARW